MAVAQVVEPDGRDFCVLDDLLEVPLGDVVSVERFAVRLAEQQAVIFIGFVQGALLYRLPLLGRPTLGRRRGRGGCGRRRG